jgi:hypothetical protein
METVNRRPTRTKNRQAGSKKPATGETAIYWHRELPPADAEIVGEHTLEAVSVRVPGTLAHRDELWDRCYHDLKAQTTARLKQEIERLGGDYAHVLDEAIDTRHDYMTGEAWLHGRFTYVLLRR